MFISKIEEIIDLESDSIDDDEDDIDYIENYLFELEDIIAEYGLNTPFNIDSLYERIEEIRDGIIENDDSFDEFSEITGKIKSEDLDSEIEEMFLSLQIN